MEGAFETMKTANRFTRYLQRLAHDHARCVWAETIANKMAVIATATNYCLSACSNIILLVMGNFKAVKIHL